MDLEMYPGKITFCLFKLSIYFITKIQIKIINNYCSSRKLYVSKLWLNNYLLRVESPRGSSARWVVKCHRNVCTPAHPAQEVHPKTWPLSHLYFSWPANTKKKTDIITVYRNDQSWCICEIYCLTGKQAFSITLLIIQTRAHCYRSNFKGYHAVV